MNQFFDEDDSEIFEGQNLYRVICFDISNLLFRSFFVNRGVDDVTSAGLAHHQALTLLNKYFKQVKPDKVIMTYDRSNWRKEYTKSEDCISKKLYKGNRRQDMTPSEKARYELFMEHLSDFEDIMREHTSVACLAAKLLEADDLMAGVAEYYNNGKSEVTFISADKDLTQLLRFNHVKLITPINGKEITLEEWDDDPDWFMFVKYFRGDRGDNVQSAYPKVRMTRLKKAYTDPYEHEKIFNETWTDQNGTTFLVKDLFYENKLLMDLFDQPQPIRDLIFKTINEGVKNSGSFSMFKFLKFCGKYELKVVSDHIERYIPLLSK